MNRTHLVQRLIKPYKGESKLSNPFSFGSGLRNGGLSDKAMKLIGNIFEFDYMGSSEFEWGAVPKALATIYEMSKNYISFEITVPWKHKIWNKKNKAEDIKGKSMVYVICDKEWKSDVIDFIKTQAVNPYSRKWSLQEPTLLEMALSESIKYSRVHGWLELSNGYFFFSDKEMFDETCKLFEIKGELQ